ncbi:MAG: NADP-dependent oxidoreductase [Pseudomonadales bacterium]
MLNIDFGPVDMFVSRTTAAVRFDTVPGTTAITTAITTESTEIMADQLNRQIRLMKRPDGPIKDSDFATTEEPLQALEENQVRLQNLYFALDPALRGWMDDFNDSYIPPVPLGSVMLTTCISRVIESNNTDYPLGSITRGLGAWELFSTVGAGGSRQVPGLEILDIDPAIPLSNYLSICGTTGLTSYFGMLDVGVPKDGETILVSGAAGAVGSVAGQLAKRAANCRVVGLAGSEEKCAWLRNELGFDVAINYRESSDMRATLAEACPEGIDLFFDNVGGEILDAALLNLNFKARVLMCGTISNYNNEVDDRAGPANMWQLLVKNARIEGFTVAYFAERWAEGTAELASMVKNGELKHKEQIVEGLDNTLDTFRGLFNGANQGRLIIKLAD